MKIAKAVTMLELECSASARHALLPEVEAGYVEVGDLPWTEIDFPEDVKRAEGILEELRALGVE